MAKSKSEEKKAKRRTFQELAKEIGPIALFVRTRRKSLSYTQAELAERSGVGLNFIRRLETGVKSLRLDKVNQVLFFFGAELQPVPKKD